MRRIRSVICTGVLALIPALLSIQCGGSDSLDKESEPTRNPEPNRVRISATAADHAGIKVETVRSHVISDTVRTTGVVNPDQDSISRIRPLSRGRIEKVFVGLGDYVHAESPLAEYDNIELGTTAGEYRNQWAELQRDFAAEEVAKRSFARAQELLRLQAISQREYELRESELKSAQSAVSSRQAILAALGDKLHRFGMQEAEIGELMQSYPNSHSGHFSHTTLRSPVDGIVVKREVVVGEAVDFESELFTIVDISHVWVQANIAEKDLSKISHGNSVKIRTPAYPGEIFRGSVAYISDMLDPETRVVKVRCVVPNPKRRLKLEMYVDVEIEILSTRRALMVPHSALLEENETYYVYVERDAGEFERRVVSVAAKHTEFTEILGGLHEGDRIVVAGAFYLKSESQRESIGEGE